MPPNGAVTAIPCPHLPDIGARRHAAAELGEFRHGERGSAFYRHALRCGQSRWLEGLPAQSLLMLNRAMGARLCATADAEALIEHPIPYRAIGWILNEGERVGFLGNPRRHYQHLATRMSGWDVERRTARAWACWELAKRVNPEWEADLVQIERENVIEPTFSEVERSLLTHGLPGEYAEWSATLRTMAV